MRGIGPKTEARIREGLAETATARLRRGMVLSRARALVGEIAVAVGGEPAGDPRRGCDLSTRFAVVVAEADALDHFERLPQIVSVLERSAERSVGVTAEGVPVEAVFAPPERFGTALLRATGSVEYVAGLEPVPERATEMEVYTAITRPFRPPELRELDAGGPAAGSRSPRRRSRRPARAYDRLGRKGDRV